MDFNFIFPGNKRKNEEVHKDINKNEMRNISILKEQLIATGYNPGEVDYMIKTSSNGVDLTKLDSKQLKKIEEILKEQLSIARQCIEYIRGPQ